MKVLHVHTRYRERGGEDTVVDAERALLSGSKYEVTPLDFHNPTSVPATVSALAQSPWNRGAVTKVVAAAERVGADVVHVHNTWFALSAAVVPALSKAGFPVVMTFHNYRLVCVNAMLYRDGQPCELCVRRSTVSGIRYRCYRDSVWASAIASAGIQIHRYRETWASQLSVAIVLTSFAEDRLLSGGLPPDRTVVKPNFVADPGSRSIAPSESSEILFVGRLSPEKGIERLVDVWNSAELGDLGLTVIGSGPLESSLSDKITRNVRLVGPQPADEVMALMLRARAIVVPSLWYEGQPMVMLEALSAGLPIFHTDMGALQETAGAGGISLGSGETADMARSLPGLLDARLVDETGRAGRFEYERRFSQRASLRDLDRIYNRALSWRRTR